MSFLVCLSFLEDSLSDSDMEELLDSYAEALKRNQSRQLEVTNLAANSQPVHANPAKRPWAEGGSEQSMQMFLSLGERMCTLMETIQRSIAPKTASAKEPASEDKEDEKNHVFQQTVNVFDDGVMNLHDRSAPQVVNGLITKNSSFSGPMERTHVIGVSSGDQVSSYSS